MIEERSNNYKKKDNSNAPVSGYGIFSFLHYCFCRG